MNYNNFLVGICAVQGYHYLVIVDTQKWSGCIEIAEFLNDDGEIPVSLIVDNEPKFLTLTQYNVFETLKELGYEGFNEGQTITIQEFVDAVFEDELAYM